MVISIYFKRTMTNADLMHQQFLALDTYLGNLVAMYMSTTM